MLDISTAFSRRLLGWYDKHQRILPWRTERGGTAVDPYFVLVSEAMLQQTQVATVIPYFRRFVARFPTAHELAHADGQEVLRHWQGLGYYSRARNLHLAAKKIVEEFSGKVPDNVDDLLTLPGVGKYTAGAVASIAFGKRAPILDGNVIRVLCRLDCILPDPRDPATRALLWTRADQILPRQRLGDFNSALMELGALVCTPRQPNCGICPVRQHCQALAAGMQEQIPPAKKTKPTPIFHRWTFCIHHGDQYLIEQRPTSGRWAGMWQFVTLEANSGDISSEIIQTHFALRTSKPGKIGEIAHALTHRRYVFDVFVCEAVDRSLKDLSRKWVTLRELEKYPLPRPHLKMVELLKAPMLPVC